MSESLFRVGAGFSIDDNVSILYGITDPTTASGVVAPVGSMYMQNAAGTDGGAVWCKVGEADTAWQNISASSIGLRWLASTKATTIDDVSAFSGTAETFTDDAIGIALTLGDRIASKADNKIYVVGAGTAYAITGVNTGLKQFTIAGDHTVIPGTKIKIAGSTGNDGTYTVVTSVFGTSTVVTVAEVVTDATVDGNLTNCWQVASDGNLVTGDTFFSNYTFIFTSDPSLQGPYAVSYNGATLIKLAAFDFEFATTIKLSAGYTPVNGNISAGNTVEKAISNLDANQADLQTVSGVAQGATNLGTWTTQPGYLADNTETTKSALNKLNTGLSRAKTDSNAGPITSTPVVLDSVLVDDFDAAHWLIVAYETATPAKKIASEIFAVHNGTVLADATAVDHTRYGEVKTVGTPPKITGYTLSVVLAGTGVTQTMDLMVVSTTSVMVKAIRVSV